MEVLPATGGPHPFGVLAQRLRAGKLVALPCDRDVTGGGIEVDFFGEKALMMGGPAALAVQTGAALMPATLWFEGDRWGVRIHEEIPVPAVGDRRQKAAAMTQEVARVFEQGISEHPADWHMLQRVFVADLDPERLAAVQGPGRGQGAGGAAERCQARPAERRGARPARGRPAAAGACRRPASCRPLPTRTLTGHESRPGLPVLLGRPRRRTGAHQGPGRGPDRPRSRRLGDLPGRRRRQPARLCRAGRPGRSPFPTTARSPGWRSGRCRPTGSAGGSRTATSTSCTCMSLPRPACR